MKTLATILVSAILGVGGTVAYSKGAFQTDPCVAVQTACQQPGNLYKGLFCQMAQVQFATVDTKPPAEACQRVLDVMDRAETVGWNKALAEFNASPR